MNNLFRFLALFLLGSFSLVFAQVPARIPVNVFQTTSGAAITTYAAGSLTAAGLPGSTLSISGGSLVVDALQRQSLSSGRVLDVTARVVPNPVEVGKAFGRFAGRALPVLATGVALYDLARELGYFVDNSTGPLVVTKLTLDPALCYVAPCYLWPLQTGVKTQNKQTAAQSVCDFLLPVNDSCTYTVSGSVMTITARQGATVQTTTRQGATGGSVVTAAPGPSSAAALEADITSRTSWSSTSAIGRLLTDAVTSGIPLPLPAPTSITGPSSVAGPTSVVSRPAVGATAASTVTTNVTNNITYGPTTVTVSQVTITTSSDPTVPSTTTTSEPPVLPKTDCELSPTSIGCAEMGNISDKPLPGPPVLYKPKYPDGLTGVWNEKIAGIKASPLFNAASNLMPSVASGGACPIWMLPLNVGIKDFGSHDVAPPCWIWTFGRFVIVVSALLLARSLIFGG